MTPSEMREAVDTQWKLRAANEMADAIAVLVQIGKLDSRSRAADALLDYRNPPRTERTDALAELTAEIERLTKENEGLEARLIEIGDHARNCMRQDRKMSFTKVLRLAGPPALKEQADGE